MKKEYTFFLNNQNKEKPLSDFIPKEVLDIGISDGQKAIPKIAKNEKLVNLLETEIKKIPSSHHFINEDCRNLTSLPSNSVHLVVTSPPYWILKQYPINDSQLGNLDDYDSFLFELDNIWREIFRILVPNGRLVIVVGDVCIPRRKMGYHTVIPLHASIQEHCRSIGFHNLSPIIWYKIANARFEAKRSGQFLGKPYEPNAVIKNDIEYILFQRKPGAYRSPSLEMRLLSLLSEKQHRLFFTQIWDIKGASTKNHPAPYPIELAERLIRMFSFVGDSVLDPFSGLGSTAIAAGQLGRNSISYEIEPSYFEASIERFRKIFGQNSLNL